MVTLRLKQEASMLFAVAEGHINDHEEGAGFDHQNHPGSLIWFYGYKQYSCLFVQ